ncbi:MAG: TonB-dependent receptor [Candidatus Eremiobacteraeota bacterium]|nr:TonB-dependent receptor [Candidatus Eremiobacteraeota bacterium]
MNHFIRILSVIALAAFSVGPVSAATVAPQQQVIVAQSATTGSIAGKVTDSSGAPVSNANVKLSGASTYITATDAKGAFQIANITPGIYSVIVSKPGYNAENEANFAVVAGSSQNLTIALQALTFSSLRSIATVRATGRGTFNASPASVAVIPAQTFQDQAQPQIAHVLNQIPGVVSSLPGVNGAVPGAITFPNIRGALSFETASLIDGHPISVGRYGDYVTTFLSSYMFGATELVKGPGADAPVVNYAIGGTLNFRTKDPTYKPTGTLSFGTDTFGGYFTNLGYSGTTSNGKFGWVLDYARNSAVSAVDNYQAKWDAGSFTVNPLDPVNNYHIGFNDNQNYPSSGVFVDGGLPYNTGTLVACCKPISADYKNDAELLKLRYKLSEATVFTASYLGSQTTADQNANNSSQTPFLFAPDPAGGYSGSLSAGNLLTTNFYLPSNLETNNEPIFQAEIRTTVGKDTLLARAYSASIARLGVQGPADPNAPVYQTFQLFGTAQDDNGGNHTYNGQYVNVQLDSPYYHQTEIDKLTGYSVQYNHPIGADNLLSASVDTLNSKTRANTISGGGYTTYSIPDGSGQRFTTAQLRGTFHVGPKLTVSETNYFNMYRSTYPVACATGANCHGDTPNFVFNTSTTSHFDPRLAVEFRPSNQIAMRFAMGSSIAPPYINLLSQLSTSPYCGSTKSCKNASQTLNAGAIKPETAWGYDLGGDYRFKDGATTASLDLYTTTLYNQYLAQTFQNGTCIPDKTTKHNCNIGTGPGAVPLFAKANVNLNTARYQGVEFALRRNPVIGWGYEFQGALQKAYPFNLGPCFYSNTPTNCSLQNTNLAILPNSNYNGGGLADAANGVSNQNIPYAQGYAELHYNMPNHGYASFGETYYGNNNSLYVKPFFVANATLRYPLANQTSVQVSVDNIFNSNSALFPLQNSGIPISLANGLLGLTQQNTYGPRTIRFVFTKDFGGTP